MQYIIWSFHTRQWRSASMHPLIWWQMAILAEMGSSMEAVSPVLMEVDSHMQYGMA